MRKLLFFLLESNRCSKSTKALAFAAGISMLFLDALSCFGQTFQSNHKKGEYTVAVYYWPKFIRIDITNQKKEKAEPNW